MAARQTPTTIAESQVYRGDPDADAVMQFTWKTGILVTTDMPTGAHGLVLHFRGPGDADWWDSQPVAPDLAEEVALRIGDGDVVFGASVVAGLGSAACEAAPATTFSEPQPFDPLVAAGATLPKW